MSLLELPSTREEAWRWADLGALSAAAALAPVTAPDAEFLDLPGARLLFVDGVLDEARSVLGPVAMAEIGAGAHILGRHARGRGWSLRLGAGTAAADPVQVVHVATGGENHLPAEIVLADGAAATVVETFVGAGWANRATRIDLGQAARLRRYVRLLQGGGFTSLREEVELGAGASLVAVFLGAGDAGAASTARSRLQGRAGTRRSAARC